jgi:hypothetical protein
MILHEDILFPVFLRDNDNRLINIAYVKEIRVCKDDNQTYSVQAKYNDEWIVIMHNLNTEEDAKVKMYMLINDLVT